LQLPGSHGVMRDPNWPRDEYEWLVGPLLTLLESGTTEAEIGSRLRKEIVEYFGLSPEHYDFPAMGARVRVWFDRAWRDLQDPITSSRFWTKELMLGGLSGASLGDNLFRIVAVEADVSDETWQFPAGAIVRCEPKQFSDGQAGIVAVECVEGL